jgi:hypothetical protein
VAGRSDSPAARAVGCNANDANQHWTFNTVRSVCDTGGACLSHVGNPGSRSSYSLWTLGHNASAGSTQEFDRHHADSDSPINPHITGRRPGRGAPLRWDGFPAHRLRHVDREQTPCRVTVLVTELKLSRSIQASTASPAHAYLRRPCYLFGERWLNLAVQGVTCR